MTDVNMRILLAAQAGNTLSVISGVTKALGSGSGGLTGAMVGVGVAAGALAVGFVASAVKMAASYQQSMDMVQALTGASSEQMAQYDSQLKALAVDAGVAPTALSQGLYQVISAGYSGAAAMNVLKLATEDSKIGMTDAATTSEALTNVLANFTWETKNAAQVNGDMLETVTLGKSTFQQYASTITKAASTSAQFHISLETTSAAWATMTANGISAGKASTDYVQLVQAMDGKVQTIAKSLKKNGIAFNETAFNAESFGQKVQTLNQILQEAAQKHVQVTGVTLQAAQAVTVISSHMGAFNSDLATLSNKQAMANKTQDAWAITQKGFNQQLDRASAAWDVLLIQVGTRFLPIVTQIMQNVTPLILRFADWVTTDKGVQAGLADLGSLIQYTIVPAIVNIVSWTSQFVQWMQKGSAPATVLKGAILGLGAAFVALKIKNAAGDLLSFAGDLKGNVTSAIETFLGGPMAQMQGNAGFGGVKQAAQEAETAVGGLGPAATTAEGEIKAAAPGMISALSGVASLMNGIIAGLPLVIAAQGLLSSQGINDVTALGPGGPGVNPKGTAQQIVGFDQSPLFQWWQSLFGTSNNPGINRFGSHPTSPQLTTNDPNQGAYYGGDTPPPLKGGPKRPSQPPVSPPPSGDFPTQLPTTPPKPYWPNPTPVNFHIVFGDVHVNGTSGNPKQHAQAFVDEIEKEMASRFRSQASGYGYGGLT